MPAPAAVCSRSALTLLCNLFVTVEGFNVYMKQKKERNSSRTDAKLRLKVHFMELTANPTSLLLEKRGGGGGVNAIPSKQSAVYTSVFGVLLLWLVT